MAEEQRKQEEAERIAEEQRQQEEAERVAEEQRKQAETERIAEEKASTRGSGASGTRTTSAGRGSQTDKCLL